MDEHITPQMFIDYVLRTRGLSRESMGVAPVVVGSWSRRVVERLKESLGAGPSPPWLYGEVHPLYSAEVGGRAVCLTTLRVGAPAAIIQAEELIACGARSLIGVGYAGSLQPDVPVGSLFIPTACLSEEGTSAHYGLQASGGGWAGLDVPGPAPRLARLLQAACEAEGIRPATGTVWTTDAPYRELRSKVERYRAQGVVGVDMETSAMYTLGRFRNVEVCHLLLISDELWHEWRPAFGSAELRTAEERAAAVLLRVLQDWCSTA
ncbi:MAG: nucleoside phosphorylase [Bacillota bacterium]